MSRSTTFNKIVTPELLAQVNQENIELRNDFLDYLKSVQRSEGTILQYGNDLNIAFVWNLLHNNNCFYCDWTKRHVVKLQNWLLNINHNSPARVRRVRSTLSSLGNYVENILDDEFPNFRNIINKIEAPVNMPVREKTVLTEDDVQTMLNTIVSNGRIKTACYFALAVYGGRRKSELCLFKISDFDDDHLVCDGALYKSDPIKTKGRGLGKFINCYTLSKPFKPYLDLWLKERKEKDICSPWLFPDEKDPTQHIKIATVNSWTKTVSKLTGFELYPHALRHRFVTSLSEAGIPDGVIQTIVNWSTADMVRIYKDIDAEDEIAMYFKDGDIASKENKKLTDL